MDSARFIEEGRRLARPCLFLVPTPQDGPIVAHWGGPGVVPPEGGPFDFIKHILSVDCSWFAAHGFDLSGCLSLYLVDDPQSRGRVWLDRSRALPPQAEGAIPLYGRPGESLPTVDGVFRFGGPAVRDWLAGHGWVAEEHEQYSPDGRVTADWEEISRAQCPLLVDAHRDTAAILGGWPTTWPDGDWYERCEKPLLIWTFRDAEPWYEVYLDGPDSFEVVGRVT